MLKEKALHIPEKQSQRFEVSPCRTSWYILALFNRLQMVKEVPSMAGLLQHVKSAGVGVPLRTPIDIGN